MQLRLPALALSALLASGAGSLARSAAPVAFDWFEYSGHDVTEARLGPGQFHNPILSGFYPDPAVCRVGQDYYLINSTFAYFPGIPIFHSRDLVNWEQIGNVISRPDQLRYDGLHVSEAIFAPSITHHRDTFYVICTMVGSNGNFVVTAKDPAGPWSDPVRLEFAGIDPSIFVDDDGSAWIVNNDAPDGPPLYDGHRAIRIQSFDLKTLKVSGPRKVLVNGGVDLATKPIWIEGPHLYKRDGWYYLSCAEGGTGPGHSQVVFRSRRVDGPYEPWDHNPILTQRDLDPSAPGAVTCTGHANLVEGPDGKWWAVFLGVRPYERDFSPMGRETFLAPVTWTDDGWPAILPPKERVPLVASAPGGATVHPTAVMPGPGGSFTWRDDFTTPTLSPLWLMLRTPHETWWSIDATKGRLLLTPRADTLAGTGNPSFLARRVQHVQFTAATRVEVPAEPGVAAGLVAFQGERFHYFLAVRRDAKGATVFLEKHARGSVEVVRSVDLPADGPVSLRITADHGTCDFAYSLQPDAWRDLVTGADAKLLTSAVAGGFVGATVGVHARLEQPAADTSAR